MPDAMPGTTPFHAFLSRFTLFTHIITRPALLCSLYERFFVEDTNDPWAALHALYVPLRGLPGLPNTDAWWLVVLHWQILLGLGYL